MTLAPRLVLGRAAAPPGWRSLVPGWGHLMALRGSQVHQHTHVIGVTGQGKSKLLATRFLQLHQQGIACGLIDPHADLARDCLRLLVETGSLDSPADRARLLYVDFSDPAGYLPFNVLRQAGHDPHTIARNLVEACQRAWPSLAQGAAPTFENIMLHAAVVLVESGQPLTCLTRLLTDKHFRDMSLNNVNDDQVVHFFHERYDRWGREGVLMRESTLNRAALLTFSPTLRYTLGQTRNALDFRAHLDQGISVIYNLGGLDAATQTFLGCLLTVGYETAALARADLPEHERRPWHLIIDEFSLFTATTEGSFARILSLARKHGLYLTLAHQTWSQVSARLQGALQNTLTIAFRLGRSDAEWLARHLGRFEPQAIKHLVDDPQQQQRSHPLFVTLPETYEAWAQALEDLRPRDAYIGSVGEAQKIRTLLVPDQRVPQERIEAAHAFYRDTLLRSTETVRAEVNTALQEHPSHPLVRPVRRVTRA